MGSLAGLMSHAIWVWLAVGVVLLAAEAATGSGWLLWPAASAGAVAVLTVIGVPLGLPGQIAVFAVLTVLSTFLARRYLVRAPAADPDINDQSQRLLGKTGETREAFVDGSGRAFVNGAEWPADLEGGGDLGEGERVVVTAVNGPRLIVKPA